MYLQKDSQRSTHPLNPQMFTLSRNYHGLSKKAVAEKIGVSPGFITHIENGAKTPSSTTIEKLTRQLGFPKSFYHQPGIIEAPSLSLFRRRQTINKTTMTQCTARIALFKKSLELLLAKVDPPKLRLPSIDLGEQRKSPQEAARLTRLALRIPPGPIFNLTAILESSGIIISPFRFGTLKVDGYSDWVGNVPFILFNPETPRSRLRHTLAHELGHLIMHQIITENYEDEANRFAAELNMPALEIQHQLSPVTLNHLAQLKVFWRCSMAALLYRAFDLDVISPRAKRYYWSMMRKYGYHQNEPHENIILKETPEGLRELGSTYLDKMGYTRKSLIKYLRLFEEPFARFFDYDKPKFQVLDGAGLT